MIDKRKLAIALGALALVVAIAFGLSLVGGRDAARETSASEATAEPEKPGQDACASRETLQGLKKLVFDQASRLRTGERTNFDILSASAFPRMENPVLSSRDEALDLTACAGRFVLELPPGAERAFGGERRLVADVRYEVQPAADGSGPVYRMSGAEGLISQLAAFELPGEPLQLPEDVLDLSTAEENGLVTAPPPVGAVPPVPAPSPPVGNGSNPSFDCAAARTRSEILVCGSDRLARRDRRMVALFDRAMADAGPRTRRILLTTRDHFLAYRDRCPTNDCIEEAYEDRMDEIRDIMRAGD